MELLYSHKVVSAMTIQTTFRKRPTKKCMRRLGQLLTHTRVDSQEARTSYKLHFGRKFIACNFPSYDFFNMC